jgi:hypothetical protein
VFYQSSSVRETLRLRLYPELLIPPSAGFVHVFARSSFEFFIEGHLMAFSAVEGIPYGMRYDNLTSVVA